MKRRVAARLLLASCALALGLGLGTATAVNGVLALQHPTLTVRSPEEVVGRLDRGRHRLFVVRNAPGGLPPVSVSQPACKAISVRTGEQAAAVPALPGQGGFAILQVERSGRHRAVCTSTFPVTVSIDHDAERAPAYLRALGRGLLPAVLLTLFAALLAARALVALRRFGPTPEVT